MRGAAAGRGGTFEEVYGGNRGCVVAIATFIVWGTGAELELGENVGISRVEVKTGFEPGVVLSITA